MLGNSDSIRILLYCGRKLVSRAFIFLIIFLSDTSRDIVTICLATMLREETALSVFYEFTILLEKLRDLYCIFKD